MDPRTQDRMARREHGRRKVVVLTAVAAVAGVAAVGGVGLVLSGGTSGASTGTTSNGIGSYDGSGVQSPDQLQAPVANPGSATGYQSHSGSGAS